jgi:disulfide bond formation protein DsbB
MQNEEVKVRKIWALLFFAWLVALIATLGSLFFSEVMGYIPCTLCWYQRIMMYPLVIVLFVGMMHYDKTVLRYATPLVIIGWLLSVYHNLIQYNIITESATQCVIGAPCTTKYISYFGFVTIPFLSFVAFSIIGILLIIIKNRQGKIK